MKKNRNNTKFVAFEFEEKTFGVDFRYNWFRGVYDVELRVIAPGGELLSDRAKLELRYPNILRRIKIHIGVIHMYFNLIVSRVRDLR